MIIIVEKKVGHEDFEGIWRRGAGPFDEVGVKLGFINNSLKTIKYIKFDVQAYNAVNDYVTEVLCLNITGPIEPGRKQHKYQLNNAWYNSTIVDFVIHKITITYMDGSEEILNGSQIVFNIQEEGCYVATCVYGSYDCPQVWTLRRYRDYTLDTTWYGRLFIKTYYAISPTLVKWFGHTNWFKKMWKGKLDKMVAKLQSKGVESTPYNDKY